MADGYDMKTCDVYNVCGCVDVFLIINIEKHKFSVKFKSFSYLNNIKPQE